MAQTPIDIIHDNFEGRRVNFSEPAVVHVASLDSRYAMIYKKFTDISLLVRGYERHWAMALGTQQLPNGQEGEFRDLIFINMHNEPSSLYRSELEQRISSSFMHSQALFVEKDCALYTPITSIYQPAMKKKKLLGSTVEILNPARTDKLNLDRVKATLLWTMLYDDETKDVIGDILETRPFDFEVALRPIMEALGDRRLAPADVLEATLNAKDQIPWFKAKD